MGDAILVGVLAAIGGGAVAALISGLFQSPKTKAEAAKLLAEQGQTIDGRWEKLSDELDERLTREREEHRAALEELREAGLRDAAEFNRRLAAVEAQLAESQSTVASLRSELAEAAVTIRRLRDAVERERRATRSVVVWAIALRDELVRLGGAMPLIPKHVEDYMLEMGDPPE